MLKTHKHTCPCSNNNKLRLPRLPSLVEMTHLWSIHCLGLRKRNQLHRNEEKISIKVAIKERISGVSEYLILVKLAMKKVWPDVLRNAKKDTQVLVQCVFKIVLKNKGMWLLMFQDSARKEEVITEVWVNWACQAVPRGRLALV